jgi:hypothetical protein
MPIGRIPVDNRSGAEHSDSRMGKGPAVAHSLRTLLVDRSVQIFGVFGTIDAGPQYLATTGDLPFPSPKR